MLPIQVLNFIYIVDLYYYPLNNHFGHAVSDAILDAILKVTMEIVRSYFHANIIINAMLDETLSKYKHIP